MLTRDEFREQVFARDQHRCVVCGDPAVDAHHLLERRLWTDGGYHLDNGASVCGPCHLLAEQTLITIEQLREFAGITKTVIPEHLYPDQVYTKWGDPILDDGTRLPGELFYDESVQKVLARGKALELYRRWVKHPRTMHLPWSPGVSDDDRVQHDLELLKSGEVVVTEKLDGEQTTMYTDHIHARSVDSGGHPSRDWVKNLWSQVGYNIPAGWRVCGENMYAKHSIGYDSLESWFYVHSIWNDAGDCLSYDDTLEWCGLCDLPHVPELYRGPYDEALIKAQWNDTLHDTCEGYVVRSASSFPMRDVPYRVLKFVRPGHVQTTKHWMHGQAVEVNGRA